MSDGTKIEWTDATWNPITGCSVVSAGCKHCYAMKLAGTRLQHHPSRAGLTIDTKEGPVWNGEVRFNEQWLDQPIRWKRPRMIFVCAHGDLFHESVPDEWIDKIFAVMALCPQHVFQVLTKRPERMKHYFVGQHRPNINVYDHAATMINGDWSRMPLDMPHTRSSGGKWWPLPNVWLGISAENQETADERIPLLLQTPAAVRWVSAEPLLGTIDLTHLNKDKETNELDCLTPYTWEQEIENWRGTSDEWEEEFLDWYDLGGPEFPKGKTHPGIDWVVVGGESGHNARPISPDWAGILRNQCKRAGVPFLFKQWGEWIPMLGQAQGIPVKDKITMPDGWVMGRAGKKAAGRLLDGVQHDGYPGRSK